MVDFLVPQLSWVLVSLGGILNNYDYIPISYEVRPSVILATRTEIMVEIAILIVIAVPMILLAVKILRGDFWPGHLLEQFREGKRENGNEDDGNE